MAESWEQFQHDWQRKKVLVFGIGRQGGGVGVANTLILAGAHVRANDQRSAQELSASLAQLHPDVQVSVGTQPETDISWAEVILKNPAVPYTHPQIQAALAQGKPVWTDTALLLPYVRERCVAITGTRGKTTTTALITAFLKAGGKTVVSGGNTPNQPALALLPEDTPDTWYVLETPSFQVEGLAIRKLSPKIAVLTTLAPDHLDRYPSLEAYIECKADLFRWQKPHDIAVYNLQHTWQAEVEAALQPNVERVAVTDELVSRWQKRYSHPLLPGAHNDVNVTTAVAVARHAGVSEAAITAVLTTFSGVPYRQEIVARTKNCVWVNDTTATTPTALEAALDTWKGKNAVFILGGTTKHLPFSDTFLKKLTTIPQARVWLTGSGTQELQEALRQKYATETARDDAPTASLQSAVLQAQALATQHQAQAIVFSPGFSSFELFRNEFDRGEQFTRIATQHAEQ